MTQTSNARKVINADMYYFLAKRLAAAALVDVAREVVGDEMADTVDSAEGADVDMDECCAYLRAAAMW